MPKFQNYPDLIVLLLTNRIERESLLRSQIVIHNWMNLENEIENILSNSNNIQLSAPETKQIKTGQCDDDLFFVVLGKTRGAVPRPVAAGETAGRDDDRTTDGGDTQLPHRAHGDAALLPAHLYAQGHLGPQRRTMHRITGIQLPSLTSRP